MKKTFLLLCMSAIYLLASDFNPQMSQYINELKLQAKKEDKNFVAFSAKRGEKVFTSVHVGKKGIKVSCVSCHSNNLTQDGQHKFTNKTIMPLAPSANPKRLTDVKDVKKWLRRNFRDVYVRQGTAKEKGDVLYYISSK